MIVYSATLKRIFLELFDLSSSLFLSPPGDPVQHQVPEVLRPGGAHPRAREGHGAPGLCGDFQHGILVLQGEVGVMVVVVVVVGEEDFFFSAITEREVERKVE